MLNETKTMPLQPELDVNLFNSPSGVKQISPMAAIAAKMMPLASGGCKAFSVLEKPFLELINVKNDINDEATIGAFSAAIKTATGATLPITPNTVSVSDDYIIYWLAPNEWMIQSTQPRVPVLDASLSQLLTGKFATVVDVSSGYTTLIMAGEKVRSVLQKGCPLDFHPKVFTVGKCAQSHFFKAGIILRPLPNDHFEVIIRRSFADYFGHILLDAVEEYR